MVFFVLRTAREGLAGRPLDNDGEGTGMATWWWMDRYGNRTIMVDGGGNRSNA